MKPVDTPSTPVLTVVVGLISGRTPDLDRCLAALEAQKGAPALEMLVPYDEPCRDVLRLADRYPAVRFIPLDGIDTREARAGATREHHDLLWTLGIRQARGRFIVLTEDHAYAHPDWCASLIDVLDRHPAAACAGGAIEWEAGSRLSYAVYLCDFGRYQNPVLEGPAAFVSDSNVCYRRDALDAIADVWQGPYQEAVVHGALTRKGLEIRLTPRAIVWQGRRGLTWRAALRERFIWGESYAAGRVAGWPFARRLVLAALTPALPFILTWRLIDGAKRRGREVGRVWRTAPALLALLAAWSCGELAGYLGGSRALEKRTASLSAASPRRSSES